MSVNHFNNFEFPVLDKKSNTCIAVSSSDEYVPFLSVYLKSLTKYKPSNRFYDIIIFEREISDENKRSLLSAFVSPFLSIRFLNPSIFFNNVKLHISQPYFKEECYFRLAAPFLLKNYEKIIFTDLDLIFLSDLEYFYNLDLSKVDFAACKEPIWKYFYEKDHSYFDISIRDYTDNILKLNNYENYYNTGVIVFSVKNFIKNHTYDDIVSNLKVYNYINQEQCLLNKISKDHILTLSPIWNFECSEYVLLRKDYFQNYLFYKESAKILHFIGIDKPWKNTNILYAKKWWGFARDSDWYAMILESYLCNKYTLIFNKKDQNITYDVKYIVKMVRNYNKYNLIFHLYKVLNVLTLKKFKFIIKLKDKYKHKRYL